MAQARRVMIKKKKREGGRKKQGEKEIRRSEGIKGGRGGGRLSNEAVARKLRRRKNNK